MRLIKRPCNLIAFQEDLTTLAFFNPCFFIQFDKLASVVL